MNKTFFQVISYVFMVLGIGYLLSIVSPLRIFIYNLTGSIYPHPEFVTFIILPIQIIFAAIFLKKITTFSEPLAITLGATLVYGLIEFYPFLAGVPLGFRNLGYDVIWFSVIRTAIFVIASYLTFIALKTIGKNKTS